MDKIESGIMANKYTLGVSMDIRGAYDHISTKAILHGLKDKGVPHTIINWYKYYLTNRQAEAKLKDEHNKRSTARLSLK